MIDAIIRGTLGEFISAMLDFYVENGLVINGLILLYALILVLAKRANARIETAIKDQISQVYGPEIHRKNKKNFEKVIDRLDFNWESLANETKIPVISLGNTLIFRIKSKNLLRKYFTTERIYKLFENNEMKKKA